MKRFWHTALIFPLLAASSTVHADYSLEGAIDPQAFTPKGVYYEATVPDTLDLAENARLAVHGLTAFLNPDANFAPYGHTYLNANPPYLSDMPGGSPNWGKTTEALIQARLMCGSQENLDVDAKTFQGMLEYMTLNPVAPTPVSKAMLALMDLRQLSPNAKLDAVINRMAEDHRSAAQSGNGTAWYYDGPEDTKETALGVTGYWLNVFIQGNAIRSLARWGVESGTPEYTEFSGLLVPFIRQPKFWAPENHAKAVCPSDHGQFCGHHHSYTQALMGLLYYADAKNDPQLKTFVRDSYEYMRTFGIARIGLFGEGCTTGDMTFLALALSRMGVGDYWDDADGYIRNHLVELQITNPDKLRKAVEKMPAGRGKNDTTSGPYDPKNESNVNVIDRNAGVFLSDSTHPTLVPEASFLYTICCTGNCFAAMYLAWESILENRGDTVQVNLLLNRASPWVDVDSFLPFEGKVVFRIKIAKSLAIRIPSWVDRTQARATLNGQNATPLNAGMHWVLPHLKSGDVAELTFPIKEHREKCTLAWKQEEFWKESTYPGPNWEPGNKTYECVFLGNMLIDIAPRETGPGYALYQREGIRPGPAPMHKVTRFISEKTIRLLSTGTKTN